MYAHFELGKIFWNMLLVLFLVFLNGFFVAAEFAFVKTRQTRLQELINEGIGKANNALKVSRKLDIYLSASQLGITLTSLALGWVGEPSISELVVKPLLAALHINSPVLTHAISVVIAFSTITFLHIVVGEQAPKSLAIQKSESVSMWLASPIIVFYKIFRPAIWLLNASSIGLLRLVGIQPANESHGAHTEEEIRMLMNQSVKSGHIDKDEMQLFDNIFEFSDRLAREVMLPRIDMDCLYTDVSYEENMRVVYETKHTRFPVAFEDKDQIVGFVHIADLLTADPEARRDLQSFLRPVLSVPESMEISHVLRLMQKRHAQLAIVVDEYGGTAGLITAEEILEEIVGEIQDEFDDERPEIEKKDNCLSVDGRVLIEELDDMYNLSIEDDEVDSIGGWLFKKLEGTPTKGQRVEAGGFIIEVAEMERLRIVRVNIYKAEKPALPADGTEMNKPSP